MPLEPFDFHTPTRVVFGPGTLVRLGELAQELGDTRVLLVTDPGLEAAGHPQRAVASLEAAGLRTFVFDQVEENPTGKHVDNGVRFAKPLDIDLIVSVGGGSAMDCAKGINFVLTNGGAISDYKGFGKAHKPMLPSIGVPTTAGTGSEAQSYALIADEATHMKMACGDRKAAFQTAILDPEVTVSQPPQVTALTGIDALSHALESYVTTARSPVSQMFAREAWKLLEVNLEKVLHHPHDLEARGAMQMGAFLAGTAIENSMLGVCHSCANPLTAHYGLTHGLAIGIMLPHVLRFNGETVGALYADLTEEAGLHNGTPDAAAFTLADRITHLLKLAGVPSRLADCGVARSILPLLADEAARQWTARFNPRPVTEKEILGLYEAAM
ncbi:MAG: iron-containing alcohol dehydrogenase [Gemmataceae bacterium]|nr:iron-containing alcohol dehydrogenase [Gemmataceae bacterium]MCI0743068.1 iron-containing alcohol dehydrogenase [Gemmataceae bacterium]